MIKYYEDEQKEDKSNDELLSFNKLVEDWIDELEVKL